jgi:hypothetical protein
MQGIGVLVNPELFNLALGFVMPSTNCAKKNFENHAFCSYEHYTAIFCETLVAIQKYYRFLLISRILCFLFLFFFNIPSTISFMFSKLDMAVLLLRLQTLYFHERWDLCTNYIMSSCWRLHQQVCLCQIDLQNLVLISLFITEFQLISDHKEI